MAWAQTKWLSSVQFKQTFDPSHLPNVFLLCVLLASQMSQWLDEWGFAVLLGGMEGSGRGSQPKEVGLQGSSYVYNLCIL